MENQILTFKNKREFGQLNFGMVFIKIGLFQSKRGIFSRKLTGSS